MRRWPILLFLIATITSRGQSYTFLTWNIRYDNRADSLNRWDARKQALAKEVMRHRPHVIGLQEVLANQAGYLEDQWPSYKRYGVGREDGKADGEFSPVLYDTTTFALARGTTLWLAPDPTRPAKGWDAANVRIATLVVLRDKNTGDSIWVVNTHWDHVGQRARRNSAAIIEGALRSPRKNGKRCVVMGDLNAGPNTPPIRSLSRWLKDSCPRERSDQPTFNDFGRAASPHERIDYIWSSPAGWEVLGYDVPHPMEDDRHLSDHFPVIAVLHPR